MRRAYKREDLTGVGIRGKHLAEYQSGTNLVLLHPEVAAAFPTADAVNEALKGLLALAKGAYLSSGKRRPTAKPKRSTSRVRATG